MVRWSMLEPYYIALSLWNELLLKYKYFIKNNHICRRCLERSILSYCRIWMLFLTVFRIHDILVRLRIRMRILLFLSWPSRRQQKIIFFSLSFYSYSFLKLHLITSFFKGKKVTRKSQNSKNQGFSSLLLVDGRIWIRIRTNILDSDKDPGGPKTYGSYGPGFGSGSGTQFFSHPALYWPAILVVWIVPASRQEDTRNR